MSAKKESRYKIINSKSTDSLSSSNNGYSSLSAQLLAKEKEYRRINEEMNAKTGKVIQDAENVMNSGVSSLNAHNRKYSVEEPILISVKEGRKSVKKNSSTITLISEEHCMNEPSSDATVRALRTRIQLLTEDYSSLQQEKSKKDDLCKLLEERFEEIDQDKTKMIKSLQLLQTQFEKYKKLNADLKNQNETLETEMSKVKKELEASQKIVKQKELDSGFRDVKLNKALEETEKYKQSLVKLTNDHKERQDVSKKANAELQLEVKKLEKQKAELHLIFKKQQQLILLLKKQKVHIQAATMLKLTEEEFVKTLETDAY